MNEHVEEPRAGTYEALSLLAAVQSEQPDWDGKTIFHFRRGPKTYTVAVYMTEIFED